MVNITLLVSVCERLFFFLRYAKCMFFLYLKMLQSYSRWKSPTPIRSSQTCSKNLTNSSALTRVAICTERHSIHRSTQLVL